MAGQVYDRIMTVLAHRNYQHHVVNHNCEFVAGEWNTYASIEAYWIRAKAIFKRMNGTQEPLEAGYLDEVMWRERYERRRAHFGIFCCICVNAIPVEN